MIINNVHCLHRLLLLISIFISLTAATSKYLEGCANFPSTSEQCFLSDIEVLPGLYTREGGIIYDGVESPEACQLECLKNIDCKYFTFRTSKTDATASCHLKPAPSYKTSPVMVIRKFESDSQYTYISGPRECGDSCKEEAEVYKGCGGSSPASCASLEKGFFSPACLEAPDADGCGQFPYYKCCKKCAEEDCCVSVPDEIFNSKTEILSSTWRGVESKFHCHSLCLIAEDCNRWSFVASPSTAAIGGACYLTKEDASVNENGQAPGWASDSYLGQRLCTATVDNTTCLQEGKQVRGHQLIDPRAENQGEENCRAACRKWPGCTMIYMTGTERTCYLLFGDGPIEDSQWETWVEKVPCTGKADTGCAIVGKALSETGALEVTNRGPFVHSCMSTCRKSQECKAWSFIAENSNCIISASTEFAETKDAISALKECEFPVEPWRRLEELFEAPLLSPHCINADMTLDKGFIEFIGGSPNVQDCYRRCLERPDCKALTYTSEGRVCGIHWGGKLIEHRGSVTVERACGECTGDSCSSRELEVVEGLTTGLAMKELGAPSTWRVVGNLVNFRDHRNWKGVRILIQPEEDKNCVSSNNSKSCISALYPAELRIQTIAVSQDGLFLGWDQMAWQSDAAEYKEQQTQFELFSINVKLTADDYGVYNLNLNGQRQSKWPIDLTSPKDFYHGTIYTRVQAISTPKPEPLNAVICITGSDFPLSEVCSPTISVPPYNV